MPIISIVRTVVERGRINGNMNDRWTYTAMYAYMLKLWGICGWYKVPGKDSPEHVKLPYWIKLIAINLGLLRSSGTKIPISPSHSMASSHENCSAWTTGESLAVWELYHLGGQYCLLQMVVTVQGLELYPFDPPPTWERLARERSGRNQIWLPSAVPTVCCAVQLRPWWYGFWLRRVMDSELGTVFPSSQGKAVSYRLRPVKLEVLEIEPSTFNCAVHAFKSAMPCWITVLWPNTACDSRRRRHFPSSWLRW